ncbi:hypothetical protein FAI40_07870 [Acetobacteraceae bacterium]|nr:hypothetical protein FAI40_07870 [Acetobacteraceae bacterium]
MACPRMFGLVASLHVWHCPLLCLERAYRQKTRTARRNGGFPMKYRSFFTLLLCGGAALFSQAQAKENQEPLKGDATKGFYVFANICNQCHGAQNLHYGDLLKIGIPSKEILAWAGHHEVPDGLDDNGNLKKRQANAFDPIALPYPTEKAARNANAGDLPPDFSHIASNIAGGTNYINSMLLAYQTPPPDMKLEPGLFYNPVALTHHRHFKMAPPFEQEAAKTLTYPDGTHPSDAQMSADISTFLEWANDPSHNARQISGGLICLYLILMGVFACLWRNRVWKK